MKSPTSFFKSSLIRSDIKRFSWAAILQTIAMCLLFVMPIITTDPESTYRTTMLISEFGQAANLTLCIYAVAIAALVFSYMHAPAGCTMLHGLPFSRTMLFVSNAFAGLVLVLIPSLLNTLALLIVKYTMDIGKFLLISEIFIWLWSNATLGIVIYALAVFVGMFAGHIIAHIVFTYIIHFLPAALYVMVNSIFTIVLYGYSMPDVPSFLIHFPMYRFGDTTGRFAWGYLLAAVILLALAWLVYRRRPLESAGDVIAFGWVKPFFKYGVTLCTAMAGYLYVAVMTGSASHLILALLFALLGYCIAEMLLRKTWNIFGAWKGYAACIAVILLFAACCRFDVFGIVHRVPDAKDVSELTISGLYMLDNYEVTYASISDLSSVGAWHEKVCEERPDTSKYDTVTVQLSYKLKNGGTLNRRYEVPIDYTTALLDLPATKEQCSVLLTLPQPNIKNITIYNSNYETLYVIGTAEELQAFTDAYRQDVTAMQGKDFTDFWEAEYYVEVQYQDVRQDRNDTYLYSQSVSIYEQCTATKQFIEALLQERHITVAE